MAEDGGPASADAAGADLFVRAREQMVAAQIAARDVHDGAVLGAMLRVPRHLFVPPSIRHCAYDDDPQPIGYDQTISQPYIVALMTELVRPSRDQRVLEIGTGSGYQTAVLAQLVLHVYSVELIEALAHDAEHRLASLGCANVSVRVGDGYEGWPAEAPFDAILVTAAPEHVPDALVAQLREGGRLVLPVGPMFAQELVVVEKGGEGRTRVRSVAPVRFVPMVGAKR